MLTILADFFVDPWIIIWAVFIVVTVIIELNTADLVTIWFSIGAIAALIATALQAPVYLQLIIFVIVSSALLVATRPLAKKLMNKNIIKTNADRVIGMIATVTKEIIPGEIGEVKVENNLWRAINLDGKKFIVGEKVLVDAITGTKLVVSKINDPDAIVRV